MVDYSKWNNIEVSDDEDDTHPNIDNASLFRWRHQARLERMAEEQRLKEELELKKKEIEEKKSELSSKLNTAKDVTTDVIQKELEKVEVEEKQLKEKELEQKKKEKVTPWNVDTISKDGFAKTVLNKKEPSKNRENLTEEEKLDIQRTFNKKYEKDLKEYGMLSKPEDSKRYLQAHPDLCCEETANYLVIWCVNLVVEGKDNLMEHVAKQCISMQYVLELAKQLEVDPRGCVASFFNRIQMADEQYKNAFEDELSAFKTRVRERGQKRLEEARKEVEEEERKNRLGPGGLDPVDVFESLPETLQRCFESRDISMLQKAIQDLPEEEARVHMKRCIDSGLWVPDAHSLNLRPSNDEAAASMQ